MTATGRTQVENGCEVAKQVLEGTGEQVALHAEQLARSRVSLTILDGELGAKNGSGSREPGAMLRRGMFPQLTDAVLQDPESQGDALGWCRAGRWPLQPPDGATGAAEGTGPQPV